MTVEAGGARYRATIGTGLLETARRELEHLDLLLVRRRAALGLAEIRQRERVGVEPQQVAAEGLGLEAAALGQQMNLGAKLYFNAVNAAGGVNGRQIVLERYDEQSTPAVAQGLFQRVLSDPPVAMIFFGQSTSLTQSRQMLTNAGLPVLSVTADDWVSLGELTKRTLPPAAMRDLPTDALDDTEAPEFFAADFDRQTGAVRLRLALELHLQLHTLAGFQRAQPPAELAGLLLGTRRQLAGVQGFVERDDDLRVGNGASRVVNQGDAELRPAADGEVSREVRGVQVAHIVGTLSLHQAGSEEGDGCAACEEGS